MSGHHHDEHGEIDWALLGAHLEASGELQLPALRQIAERLRDLTDGRTITRVVDVGAGPGVMTCVLAQVFSGAEVVAVDGSPELLGRAMARAAREGVGDRVSAMHLQVPEGLGIFTLSERTDLVWTSKTVHHLGDQQAALAAMARLLVPGGTLAVAEGGLPMRFLPRDIGQGRPGLQARLDAAQEQWFELMRSQAPGTVSAVEDWPAMLRTAGLEEVTSFTTLLERAAPLEAGARSFLHSHLERVRHRMSDWLDAADRGTLDVLLDADSDAGILRRPDAFLLSATTVVTGNRPNGEIGIRNLVAQVADQRKRWQPLDRLATSSPVVSP